MEGSVLEDELAGRSYARVYRVRRREDVFAFVRKAIELSGGRIIFESSSDKAPIYFGVEFNADERIGMLVYPFRIKRNVIKNRPHDEVRGQLRYGSEESWRAVHPLGRDVAGVDTTLILGVDIEDEIIIGLDPLLYDPLPMGISFYAKEHDIEEAKEEGWHIWEHVNRAGSKRGEARSVTGLETLVAFQPHRLIDYVRLERRASALRLDPPLRFVAARDMADPRGEFAASGIHVLERQFNLRGEQILEIIATRNRLAVAVRGGVAEYHLEARLSADPAVRLVESLDFDAMHDFNVTMHSGEVLRVECKNASPKRFSNGDYKVEVQKTRASNSDPTSRFYSVDAFDVVAACMYSPTGEWVFRFANTSDLEHHKRFPEKLAPIQHINSGWRPRL
jgi:hypothetical protein